MNRLPLHGAAFDHNFQNWPALQTSPCRYMRWCRRRVVLSFSGKSGICWGSYFVFEALQNFHDCRGRGLRNCKMDSSDAIPVDLRVSVHHIHCWEAADGDRWYIFSISLSFAPHILPHIYYLQIHHTTTAGLCVLSDGVMCCCISRGGLLDA